MNYYDRAQLNSNLEQTGIGILLASFLTGLSYAVGLTAGWIDQINYLEMFAVWTSYVCTYLCVVQSRWNYPIGTVAVIAYAFLFYQTELYASAALNIYLIGPLIYGWWRWGDSIGRALAVTHLKFDKWLAGYGAITIAAYAVGVGIVYALGGAMPFADGIILFASILAQLLLDNKKIETWFVWAFVNIFAIWLYFGMGLHLVAFQYIFFLANTVYGYVMWRKTMVV